MSDAWTNERLQLLRDIYQTGSDGWVATEINRQTKSNFSRNAVIGARHRYHLVRDKNYQGEYHRLDEKKGPQKPRVPSRRGKYSKRVLRSDFKRGQSRPADFGTLFDIANTPLPPEFLSISFAELTGDICKYPRGDSPLFVYCGQPAKEGSSYCAYCHSLCYVKPEPPAHRRDREKYYSHIAGRAA